MQRFKKIKEIENIFYTSVYEKNLEHKIEKVLNKIGWISISKEEINKNDYTNVLNEKVLLDSLKNINKNIDQKILEKVLYELKNMYKNSLIEINKDFWNLLLNLFKFYDEKTKRYINIKLIDFKNIDLNSFQMVRQLIVSNGIKKKITDIVLYINGIPMIVFEIKSVFSNEIIKDAYKQIKNYQETVPELFKFNLLNVIINDVQFRYGSITSHFSHYFKWYEFGDENKNSFESKMKIFFSKKRIINMIYKYSFFDIKDIKFIAAKHQISATENTIKRLKELENQDKFEKNKGGIIWHTPGSGKTLTMIFICKEILNNYPTSTIILITDRNQLDRQIHTRFVNAKNFLRNDNIKQIKTRKELVDELKNKKYFGIYTTTIQKFIKETGTLSKRDDVFILVDEAHRSQNTERSFKISKEKKKIIEKWGFAKFLRDAFPNATFIGFTGTPLISELSKDTRKEFGPYNDEYHLFDSVYDGMTVRIFYETAKSNLDLDKEYLKYMDIVHEKLIKIWKPYSYLFDIKQKKLLSEINKKRLIFENDKIIAAKTKHILSHWEERKKILNGKSMIIASTRIAALKYYKKIIELRPELKEQVILVISKYEKDSKEILDARVKDEFLEQVEKDFKNSQKYKFVIVVNKWLTGFDCPDLDTLYLDRFIKKHSLMQAILRVNRTYSDGKKEKQNGLIVDYLGIIKILYEALRIYSKKSTYKDKFQNEIENIEEIKTKFKKYLQKINDLYINDLLNCHYFLNDPQKSYDFVYSKFEELLKLNNNEKNNFLKLFKNLYYFYNASFTKLTDNEKSIMKIVFNIKKLFVSNCIQNDENLQNSIKEIKKNILKVIKIDEKEQVEFINKNSEKIFLKDILKLSLKDKNNVFHNKPRVFIKLFLEEIKKDLEEISLKWPIYYKKASEKIKSIINDIEKGFEETKILKIILTFLKEVHVKKFEIIKDIGNDKIIPIYEFVTNNKPKNIKFLNFIKISNDIFNIINKFKTSTIRNSSKVVSHIRLDVIKILINKYKYKVNESQNLINLILEWLLDELKVRKEIF